MSIRPGGRTGVIATLFVAMAWLALPDHPAGAQSAQSARILSAGDDALLEDLSKRTFMFFWEQADPATGIMRDRSRTNGRRSTRTHVMSAASHRSGSA